MLIGVAASLPAAAAHVRAEDSISQLQADWESAAEHEVPEYGQAWATVSIPAVGLQDEVVLEGTDADQINVGVGHYVGTAFPWDPSGNVALAGHSSGWSEPFADLDQLQPGDVIVIETAESVYTYTATGSAVVDPSQTWVLGAVPPEVTGATSSSAHLLTLTTCDGPNNEQRLVVWAELTSVQPRA